MVVEGDGLYPPQALPLDLASLFSRAPLARLLRPLEHVGEHVGVEGALVEGRLTPAVERGDYGRADVYEARGGPHVVAAGRVVPEPDGGAGRGNKRVAPHVHGRRARVGVLARKAYRVTLDPEGAEHDAQRQVHALEHGAPLYVELEVGDGVLELLSGLAGPVEVHAVLAQRVRERHTVPVLEVADVVRLEGAGGGARPEEAAAEAGPFLVGPVHEA